MAELVSTLSRSRPSESEFRAAHFFVVFGRVLLTLAFFAVVAAWTTQVIGRPILGMDQQHLFNDAIVLSLLGIAGLLDGLLHARGV